MDYRSLFDPQMNKVNNKVSEGSIAILKDPPYFGNKSWAVGDTWLMCFIDDNGVQKMVTLSDKCIDDIQITHTFVKMSGIFLFLRK